MRQTRQTQRKRDDDVVDERLAMIASLITIHDKKSEEYRKLKKEAAERYNVVERTIDRYYDSFMAEGIDGLRRGHAPGAERKLPEATIKRGIELLLEDPKRSVSFICSMLETENYGHISRSTLQDAFEREGYSKRDIRIYQATKNASTRFEKEQRNMLWMGDIKYGPEVMFNGVPTKTYLSALIDDYSRLILHAEFYPSLEANIAMDTFKKAIYKYGKPEVVYFDNGTQYRTDWMMHTCNMLGIKLQYAKPKHPYSKGKVERFLGFVDEFLNENEKHPAKTINELNITFAAWLEKRHTKRPNSTTKQTPEERYARSKGEQKFVDPKVLDRAFEMEDTRKVTKCGEISFQGESYFPGLAWAGQTVTISFDVTHPDVLYLIDDDGVVHEVGKTHMNSYVRDYQRPDPKPISDPSNYLHRITKEIFGIDLDEFHGVADTSEATEPPVEEQNIPAEKIDYGELNKEE